MKHKHSFYIMFETEDDDCDIDPRDVAQDVKELLSDGGCGDAGYKNITVVPWRDDKAEFKTAFTRGIVTIPGCPKHTKRARKKIDNES